jgi:hypothetical protein
MADYSNRLKKIATNFAKTAAARPTAFVTLPKGQHQVEITEVKLIPESKAKFALGQLEIKLTGTVLVGEFKGAKCFFGFFLEQPAKNINGKDIPSGLASFKGVCEVLNIDLPRLDDKTLIAALKAMKGLRVVAWFNGKGNNGYINSLLDSADMEIEESDEVEESEESDDVEEEEAPPVKKVKGKVAKEEVEEEEEEEEETEDDDDAELDLDDVEV